MRSLLRFYSSTRRRTRVWIAVTAAAALTLTGVVGAVIVAGSSSEPSTGLTAPGSTASPSGTPTGDGANDATAHQVAAREGGGGRHASKGRISLEELTSVPVDLPQWGTPVPEGESGGEGFPNCPTTAVTLRSSPPDMLVPFVSQIGYGDVDRDGTEETVALLDCYVYQAGREQVVAFDRNAAGAVVVLGQVVRQNTGAGGIKHIYDFTFAKHGRSVGVQVSDRQPCCGSDDRLAEHQRRWYSWGGQGFVQTGGPTEFHPIPAEYGLPTVTVTSLTLGPSHGGKRTGSATATITNPGPAETPGVWLTVTVRRADSSELPAKVQIAVKGAKCAEEKTRAGATQFVCHLPSLAAGATTTAVFTVTSPQANDSAISGGFAEVEVGAEQPGIRMLSGSGSGEPSRARAEISIAK